MGTRVWRMDGMLPRYLNNNLLSQKLMGQFRVNELLISQSSSSFHACGPITNQPKISHDGRALVLDVEAYDALYEFILRDDFIDDPTPQDLQNFLVAILNVIALSKNGSVSRRSPIMSMATVLLVNTRQDHPQSMQHASSWLCYILASKIFNQLIAGRRKQYKDSPRRLDYKNSTSDSFLELLVEHHTKEGEAVDNMLDLFEEVLSELPDEPWPSWSQTPRKFDMDVHLKCMTETFDSESAQATSGRSDAPNGTTSSLAFIIEAYSHWLGMIENPDALASYSSQEEKLISAKFEPPHPELYAHFTKLARSGLAWRNIFFTLRGHIGYSPKWLTGDEIVMLICGADVPYVFTPIETHHRARARQIRQNLDINDKEYYAIKKELQETEKPSIWKPLDNLWYDRQQGKLDRLDKERRKLQQKLESLTNSAHQRGTCVLQGEVYIEGIMHGEGVGLGRKLRITII